MIKKLLYIFLFCGLFAFDLNAATVEQKFKVEIGIFDAAKVNISYSFDNQTYQFLSHIQTDGLFNKFYSFQASYLTKGSFSNNIFKTSDYHYKTKSSSHIRTKQLLFDENGVLVSRLSSKDGNERLVGVELPKQKTDAYDMQTVLAMLIQNLIENQSCEMKKTVFNSKRIYHVLINDNGKETLEGKDVHKCSFYIKQENTDKGDLLWQTTAERPVYFYLKQDEKTKLSYLAYLKIPSTPLGELIAYMTDLTIKE